MGAAWISQLRMLSGHKEIQRMLYCFWRLMKKLFVSFASEPMPMKVLRSDKRNSQDLKRFSIYDLYQDCNLRGQGLTFNSAAWSKQDHT